MIGQILKCSANNPLERTISARDLGQLVLHGEQIERAIQSGRHKIREELERRGAAKLAEVQGCSVYGRTQILEGRGLKNFNSRADEKEAFYVGMDVRIDGASAYSSNYKNHVSSFGSNIEREYPSYLVTWDGRYDHPINLWVSISKL